MKLASEAGEAIAGAEGNAAAAEYLAEATYACGMGGSVPHAWALARRGLIYAGTRDVAWARLVSFDYERRAAEDPEHPGIPIDSAERRESARILRAAHHDPVGFGPMEGVFASREEAQGSTSLTLLLLYVGDYASCPAVAEREAEAAMGRGQLARAVRCWSLAVFALSPLGRLDEARRALDKAQGLVAQLGFPMWIELHARQQLALALDEGWEELAPVWEGLAASADPAFAWARGTIYAESARIAALRGHDEAALRFLGLLVPWLERAPAWNVNFPLIACHAAEVLWLLERLDHVAVIDRALRDKVIGPDFRCFSVDARLALARLYALEGRHDEAVRWFADAHRVLEEQSARPLLAIADYDEALMYMRRGDSGDAGRARPLLDAARRQFEDLGMTGWLRRAEELSG